MTQKRILLIIGGGIAAYKSAELIRTIRKAGHYFSNGELEPNLAALAVPLLKGDGALLGAISLVTTVPRMAVIDLPKLTQLLTRTAQEITTRIP